MAVEDVSAPQGYRQDLVDTGIVIQTRGTVEDL